MEGVEDFLREIFDKGRDLSAFELAEEIAGFICVVFEDLDDVAGDAGYELENLIGPEQTTDDVTGGNC